MNRAYYSIALALCLLLPSAPAWTQHYQREEVKKFDTVADPEVGIDSEFGVVRVKGHDKNSVKLKVTIEAKEENDAKARVLANNVGVTISGSGSKVTVKIHYPSNMNLDEDRALNISVYMYAPFKTRLDVKNRFGNVEVDDVSGKVGVDVKYGNVELRKSSNVRVESQYGSVSLASIGGECEVECAMGNVIAYDVPGGTFKSSYGELQITNGVALNLKSRRTSLIVSHESGALNIVSKMGNVKLANVRSGDIDASYGNVELSLAKDFGGEIRATTKFGSIDDKLDLNQASEGGPGDMETKVFGTVGKGSDKLVVKNRFGNIDIRQD